MKKKDTKEKCKVKLIKDIDKINLYTERKAKALQWLNRAIERNRRRKERGQ